MAVIGILASCWAKPRGASPREISFLRVCPDVSETERNSSIESGRAHADGSSTLHGGFAATRWATDVRNGDPITILWDPPVADTPFDEEEATRHRAAMTRAWLNSIAPGMGWTGADDLLSREREREALLVRAEPGSIPESRDWNPFEDEPDGDITEATTVGTLLQAARHCHVNSVASARPVL